jgi:amino acid transporter
LSDLYGSGVVTGNGPTLVWGYFAWSFVMIACAFSLAEISSAYPTAGASYYWTYTLAPKSYRRVISYVDGWLTWVGYVTAQLLTNFVMVRVSLSFGEHDQNQLAQAQVLLTSVFIWNPDCTLQVKVPADPLSRRADVLQPWTVVLVYWAHLLATFALNLLPRFIPTWNKLCIFYSKCASPRRRP